MSRQPSPASTANHNNQMYHQQPLVSSSSKQRTKPFATNIPGGADDVKYQAKYKELKKKVKEIELDNDRLYLKLLLAKKNIRRMNLERAILYERLAAVPPTPGRHTQELPPEHDPMYAQPPSGPPDSSHSVDPHDQALQDYLRSNPNVRVVQGQDGRVIAVEDPTANGSRERSGASGPPPPHGLPLFQGHHDSSRQLPPLPPPVPSIREPHEDVSVSNNHGYPAAPRTTQQSNNHSGLRSRGSSSTRADRDSTQVEPVRMDTLTARHNVHSRSSSASGEGHGESRSRHSDVRDLSTQHAASIPHSQGPGPEVSTSPPHPGQSPGQGRIHNHQRMGPGVHLHRQQERDPEVTRRLLHERELEREREREREVALRERLAAEEEELRVTTAWARDQAAARAVAAPSAPTSVSDVPREHARDRSRSDTPVTGSGSRPSSGQSQVYERERARPYPPRVENLLAHDANYYDAREERAPAAATSNTGGYPPEVSAGADVRKRSHHDMEVDDDGHGGVRSPVHREGSAAGSADVSGSRDVYPLSNEIRGSKRVHGDDEDITLRRISSMRDEHMEEDD